MKVRDKIQNDAMKKIIAHKFSGFIDIAPRVGKSKIICDALKAYKTRSKKKIVITAPYNPILESWKEEFGKWEIDDKDIILVNQRSLEKIDPKKVQLVICDEIHTLSEKQLELLKGFKKIFGLSGSISKESEKLLSEELDLSKIFEYTIEQAIKDEIVSDYVINLVPLMLNTTDAYIEAGTKGKKFQTTELKNYNYLSSMFNKFKVLSWKDQNKFGKLKMMWAGKRANMLYGAKYKIEKAKKIVNDYDRCLVFTARTSVADQFAPSYHSKSDENNLEKFFNQEINKLAVCEMTSMGITFPELKVGIFHQIRSNEESAIQKIMRMCNMEDEKIAEIFITYYHGTVDEKWVEKSLNGFATNKIQTISSY